MESPVRKMQKRNDYNRHKLLRKIKRRRKAAAEQQAHAAEKALRKKLRVTPPKFEGGKNTKDIDITYVNNPTYNEELGLFKDDNGRVVGDSIVLPELNVIGTENTQDDAEQTTYNFSPKTRRLPQWMRMLGDEGDWRRMESDLREFGLLPEEGQSAAVAPGIVPMNLETPSLGIMNKVQQYLSKFGNMIKIPNIVDYADDVWDKLYFDAINSGNTPLVQKLRDMHFMAKAPGAISKDGIRPQKVYHTVTNRYDPSFNSFNPNIEGSNSAIYTTDSPSMSASYYDGAVDKNDAIAHLMNNRYTRELWRGIEFGRHNMKEIRRRIYKQHDSDSKSLKQMLLQNEQAQSEQLQELKNYINNNLKNVQLHPERRKELYLNHPDNTIIDGQDSYWNNIQYMHPKVISGEAQRFLDSELQKLDNEVVKTLDKYGLKFKKGLDNYYGEPTRFSDRVLGYASEYAKDPETGLTLISNKNKFTKFNLDQFIKNNLKSKRLFGSKLTEIDRSNLEKELLDLDYKIRQLKPVKEGLINPRNGSTRDIEKMHKGITDGVEIRDVRDYGSSKYTYDPQPNTVFETYDPRNIKYSNAITYDNDGNIIPLSKRDNFNINDLRYGLAIPFTAITGYSILNSQNTMR